MVSQNVQMVNYMSSMSGTVAIPREREESREREEGQSLFNDVILGIALILLPFLVSTLLNSINVQAEYNMQQVRSEVMTLEKENSVLKLEVARLNAPVRIQQLAEKKLGMRLPVRNIYGSSEAAVVAKR